MEISKYLYARMIFLSKPTTSNLSSHVTKNKINFITTTRCAATPHENSMQWYGTPSCGECARLPLPLLLPPPYARGKFIAAATTVAATTDRLHAAHFASAHQQRTSRRRTHAAAPPENSSTPLKQTSSNINIIRGKFSCWRLSQAFGRVFLSIANSTCRLLLLVLKKVCLLYKRFPFSVHLNLNRETLSKTKTTSLNYLENKCAQKKCKVHGKKDTHDIWICCFFFSSR